MSDDCALSLALLNPQQAHAAINGQGWPWAKSMLLAGHQLVAEFKVMEADRSVQQNKFYWGVVLKEISEQAGIGGQKYAADAWHELFKRQFLARKVKKVAVAGRRRKVVSVSLGSTTDLSVRAMSRYLEEVQAFAASDLGVQFSEMHRYEPPARRRKETIDADTGEIMEAA